jgi:hypothetical protein
MGLIVFSDSTGSEDVCNFEYLEFRYALPDFANNWLKGSEFLKLVRFLRLWKKLGWTIERTDKTIEALYPPAHRPAPGDNEATLKTKLDAGFKELILRIAHLRTVMEMLNLSAKRDLLPLLSCWSAIDTQGSYSLYRQMFLNPTILKLDPVFKEDGFGNYLIDNSQTIVQHAEAVRAAFNLTEEELRLILETLKFDEQTPLTLENISGILRHGYLAKKLKLSVRELLALKAMSGIDPFLPLEPVQPAILRFIDLAQLIKRSPFKVSQLMYYLQHEDLSGKASPTRASVLAFAKTLRDDLLRIDREHTVQDDPAGEVAKAKMALVYDNKVTDTFFGLLSESSLYSVSYDHTQPELEADIRAVTDKISYDDFQKQLFFRGVMTETTKSGLENAPNALNDFKTAVQALFDAAQKEFQAFFDKYPDLRILYDGLQIGSTTYSVPYHEDQPELESAIGDVTHKLSYNHSQGRLSFSGVMTVAVKTALGAIPNVSIEFTTAVEELFDKGQAELNAFFGKHSAFFEKYPEVKALYDNYEAEKRMLVLLGSFLPTVRERLKRQQIRQTVSTAVGAELPMINRLLETPHLLHAVAHADQAIIEDFLNLGTTGVSAQYFFATDVGGTPDKVEPAVARINYPAAGTALPANTTSPETPISGVWRWYLEVPANGFYNLYVEADAGAEPSLFLEGEAVALNLEDGVWQNQNAIELKVGQLYAIELIVKKVKETLGLKWASKGVARESIPSNYLYPAVLVGRFETAYIRLLKVLAVAEELALAETELAHFGTNPDYDVNGEHWLNALPVASPSDTAATPMLLASVLALLRYAELKKELSVRDVRLIRLLQEPQATTEDGRSLRTLLTGWDSASLSALFARFGLSDSDLADLDPFIRVKEAFAVVKRLGISAAALLAGTTNEPTADTVRTLQSALRARYDDSVWLKVLQPINDELRGRQRDALVAFVLHTFGQSAATMHIDTPDKLFEYFLIDVEMDPCMQTSRIKQAISSVQLFIHRCLMNLEPEVAASDINAKWWEWMKRYRVWEANRKVFMWPENWLEPELRDDKSPFFKDLESELLQSDITEEAAATALGHYLEKLNEVAKLEICGMCYEENDNDTDGVVHVVARTADARRTYYYRRSEYGYWTPWEKVDVNIEDNPVLPVVWKGRLFLAWLSVMQEAPPQEAPDFEGVNTLADVDPSKLTTAPKIKVSVTLYWSERYNGKWQPAKTSDIKDPLELDEFEPRGWRQYTVSKSELPILSGMSFAYAASDEFHRAKLQLNSSFHSGDLRVHIKYPA